MRTESRAAAPRCSECEYRQVRMFCNLSGAALEDFDALGTQFVAAGRETLFREGAEADNIFVLCTGQAKLSASCRDGRTMILRIARPGDVLGLSACLNGLPYEVTAETLEPCRAKAIPRIPFLALLQQHGEAGQHAAQSLAREYHIAFLDARRLALAGSAQGRLAQLLLEWAATAPCDHPELRFTMALTHDELASMAGTSRETVTRLLNRMERERILRRAGSSLIILDRARLEAAAC